jgi:hypothetical protein
LVIIVLAPFFSFLFFSFFPVVTFVKSCLYVHFGTEVQAFRTKH